MATTGPGERRPARGERLGEQLVHVVRTGLALLGYLLGVMAAIYLLAFVFFLVAS